MSQQTPLYANHGQLGAQMVDFAGWRLPLNYGSQLSEHHAVRRDAGMFDISHMGVVDITGADAAALLRYALANDVKKLDKNAKALYSCMLNSHGGIIDDLIVYRLAETHYRLVINASRRETDMKWLQQLGSAYDTQLTELTDYAMIAVQGPQALAKLSQVLSPALAAAVNALRPFHLIVDNDWQIARTGYTGEDGVEIILPAVAAPNFWQNLLTNAVQPCGLGARDTLRLEAGLNLYGTDMDETTTPLESNLEWTIAWLDSTRNFIGRKALAKQKQTGVQRRLVGLLMPQSGVLRNHQRVWIGGREAGEITSGSFSPTLGHAIGMARVPVGVANKAMVERRGQMMTVDIVKLPFVRHGESLYQPI